ncbi:hypothetical protein CH063_13664 [Colletotrichum higginsianum]|uniref:Uncharacterized protein n=2 Tax=Colletotrichum higginsianum TaxID=80884 RepID=H1VVC9_COLHI|nr:hypothetical protein CH63R_08248 [Colletotrichum higginsianum IMI 349063]OBR09483.1 hypothetical protein CH63R_08248 [Colletotrichum higginsianum IMI 349063]TIC95756.1 hypothetical protein CH35J_007925 [Colletotrichum higginsianum]CCF44189.1 hypothetical protein CH063_13664 [Colletotrichum higginsianum]
MAPKKNLVFLYGEWMHPGTIYLLIHGTATPHKTITSRYYFQQATFCENPREPRGSRQRGASMEGVCVKGLTDAELAKLDTWLQNLRCVRRVVTVEHICRHGFLNRNDAFIWVTAEPSLTWSPVPNARRHDGNNNNNNGINGINGINNSSSINSINGSNSSNNNHNNHNNSISSSSSRNNNGRGSVSSINSNPMAHQPNSRALAQTPFMGADMGSASFDGAADAARQ